MDGCLDDANLAPLGPPRPSNFPSLLVFWPAAAPADRDRNRTRPQPCGLTSWGHRVLFVIRAAKSLRPLPWGSPLQATVARPMFPSNASILSDASVFSPTTRQPQQGQHRPCFFGLGAKLGKASLAGWQQPLPQPSPIWLLLRLQ